MKSHERKRRGYGVKMKRQCTAIQTTVRRSGMIQIPSMRPTNLMEILQATVGTLSPHLGNARGCHLEGHFHLQIMAVLVVQGTPVVMLVVGPAGNGEEKLD